jgi:hypothetical protein
VNVTLQGRHPAAIHRLDNPVLRGGREGAGESGQEAAGGELARIHEAIPPKHANRHYIGRLMPVGRNTPGFVRLGASGLF